MDRFNKATRSEVMRRSRSTGSRTTEWKFRSLLMRAGIRGWRLGHHSGLAGSPDVVFQRDRVAIFLDGCFWHGCRRCRSIPAANRQFWLDKIQGNRKRDRRVMRVLRNQGWRVIRIWEHELKADSGGILLRLGGDCSSRARGKHSSIEAAR